MPYADPIRKLEYHKNYRIKNRDKILAGKKKYYKDNIGKHREWSRSYIRSEHGKKVTTDNRHRKRDEATRYISHYLKSHPCIDCGESDPAVLEFDHSVPRNGDKQKKISWLRANGRLALLAEEICKCDVRCCNCHRRRHPRSLAY